MFVSTAILSHISAAIAGNERIVYPDAEYKQLVKPGAIAQDNNDFDNDEYIKKLESGV